MAARKKKRQRKIVKTENVMQTAIRREWRKNKELSLEDLHRLEQFLLQPISEQLTISNLHSTNDYRFSGAIIRQFPPNNDHYILTATEGQRGLLALPGGKMSISQIPFTVYLEALFWHKNHDIYENELFSRNSSALTDVLQKGRPEDIKRYIEPLELLAKHVDQPFPDSLSEIRIQGYREFKEEFDLEKISERRRRIKPAPKPPYILGAKPIGIYKEMQRQAGKNDERHKKWMITFNYLLGVVGEPNDVLNAVNEGYKKMGEIVRVKWASIPEILRPGYENNWHHSVHYVAQLLLLRGDIPADKDLSSGEYVQREVVVPDVFYKVVEDTKKRS
jgi:hypothetical protein